jgi:N-acetylneuraminic acid mutarotase
MPGPRVTGGGLLPGGNLLIFGGYGYDTLGTLGYLGDLWEYSQSANTWTFISGPSANQAPQYGTQGVAAAGNTPGGRDGAPTWVDSSGTLWVFGGVVGAGPVDNVNNDLWKYSVSSGEWTWVGGSSSPNATGVYGKQGVAAATNMPGARGSGALWQDQSGNVWMFGGRGYDSTGTLGELNDLWEYSPTSGLWTWVAGSNVAAQAGSYGTLGVAAIANVPGARDTMMSWTDTSGNLWLFGGEGYNSSGADPNAPEWNDLWKFPTQ